MPRKMKTLHSIVASPIGDIETQPLTVIFDMTTPNFVELSQQRAFFRHHAAILVDALVNALPQGMVDQVLAELCERRASNLRVRG